MTSSADADSLSAQRWDERIRRARHLARQYPAATDVLGFYAGLAAAQQTLAHVRLDAVRVGLPFSESLNVDAAADALPELLSILSRIAPPRLAAAAADMQREVRGGLRDFIEEYWTRGRLDSRLSTSESGQMRAFVAEALLQPFAERIALARRVQKDSPYESTQKDPPYEGESIQKDGPYEDAHDRVGPVLLDRPECPVCAGKPVVGVLREEGHGARRSLVCGFCLTEWPSVRVVCLTCGEGRFDALSVYRADALATARVDACDTCHTYTKTIDLTRDGTAVPIVDDIATLTLDVWAREQGYQRLRPNLLRL